MSKIICSGCTETYMEIISPDTKSYLDEIKLDNKMANQDGLEPLHTCYTCGGEKFEMEKEQTFGLECDGCKETVNYFNSTLEVGSMHGCSVGGSMIPCLVNV